VCDTGRLACPAACFQKGSQSSGWPAVAPGRAPLRVRSRAASLAAERNMPAQVRAGHSGYPWLPSIAQIVQTCSCIRIAGSRHW